MIELNAQTIDELFAIIGQHADTAGEIGEVVLSVTMWNGAVIHASGYNGQPPYVPVVCSRPGERITQVGFLVWCVHKLFTDQKPFVTRAATSDGEVALKWSITGQL